MAASSSVVVLCVCVCVCVCVPVHVHPGDDDGAPILHQLIHVSDQWDEVVDGHGQCQRGAVSSESQRELN